MNGLTHSVMASGRPNFRIAERLADRVARRFAKRDGSESPPPPPPQIKRAYEKGVPLRVYVVLSEATADRRKTRRAKRAGMRAVGHAARPRARRASDQVASTQDRRRVSDCISACLESSLRNQWLGERFAIASHCRLAAMNLTLELAQ